MAVMLVLHAFRRSRAARLTRDEDWIDPRPVSTPDSLAIIIEDEGAGLPAEDLAPGRRGWNPGPASAAGRLTPRFDDDRSLTGCARVHGTPPLSMR
ncbi:hypothetical protein ACFQU2_21810 [Siccirubricoccus deserti]